MPQAARDYYNEIDPFAAAWLRNLITAGVLPAGDVDERDIWDVQPDDLEGYRHCHFFAGIGGWAYALQLADWPDDRPIWTGSCPCQPFSAAGAGGGFADERHVWPAWFHLIDARRPEVVVGEQVDAAIRHGWLDLVSADLEGRGYTVGAVGLPAASVGAPHIRQRIWFVAESQSQQHDGRRDARRGRREPADGSELGHPDHQRSQGRRVSGTTGGGHGADQRTAGPSGPDGPALEHASEHGRIERRAASGERGAVGGCGAGELADANGQRRTRQRLLLRPEEAGRDASYVPQTTGRREASFWLPCDWLPCRDGKSRPVEPGTFPLAHGVPTRVGRLRGYGNAIVPQVAAEVLRAYLADREDA